MRSIDADEAKTLASATTLRTNRGPHRSASLSNKRQIVFFSVNRRVASRMAYRCAHVHREAGDQILARTPG